MTSLPRPVAALSLIAALAAGLAAPAATAGPVTDRIRQSGKLVIAHRESSVPLSYVDADKKPVGYAVELCQRLAEAVKRKLGLDALTVSYLQVDGASRIPAIVEGKADLECGSTTNNAERREKVAFTVPHYITGARFLVKADSPVSELRHFEGKRLASTKGTTPLKAIEAANQQQLLNIKVVVAPDHRKAVDMVAAGEADGFAMDDVLLYGLRAERPDPAGLKVVGKFLTIEPLAIMLSKADPDFKKIVDDEMKRLVGSREAHVIYERWFMKPIPPKGVSLNLPMNHLTRDFWKYPTDVVPN